MFLSMVLPRKEITVVSKHNGENSQSLILQIKLQHLQHNFLAGHHREKAVDKVLKMALKARLKVWPYCMT